MFEPEGLYMVRSIASANSLFGQRKQHHKIALKLIDKYLGGMIEVLSYSFTETVIDLAISQYGNIGLILRNMTGEA